MHAINGMKGKSLVFSAAAIVMLVIVSDVPNSRYAGTVNGIAKNYAVMGFSSSVAAVRPGMQARVCLQAE